MATRKHNFTMAEFLAGFVVLAGVGVAALFFAVVSGLRPPMQEKVFYASFPDTFGLNKGADVRFGGYKTGRVVDIGLDPQHPNLIRVEAHVPPNLPVNAESHAYITAISLTSDYHLEITTGAEGAALLKSGEAIPTRAGGLFQQAETVATKLAETLDNVRGLIGAAEMANPSPAEGSASPESSQGPVTVARVLRNLDGTVRASERLMRNADGMLQESRDDVNAILDKVQTIEDRAQALADEINAAVAENRPAVRSAAESAQQAMARVDAASERLDKIADALEATLSNAETLTGDAKAVVAENRPTIEDVARELRETVRYLKLFSRMIAEDPSSLVRGASSGGKK